jgi:tetratricopeptide (TPR) repeat protein
MVRPRKNPTKSNALPVKEGNITKQLQATAELSEAEEQAIELIKQGKLSESEAIYRRLIAEGKNTYTIYGNLAAICGMQKRFEEVIELLHKTLTLKPDYPEAHYNLGIVLKKQGDLRAAITSYKNALQLEPNYAEAHYSLGIALHQQGDLDNAVREFRAVLQLKNNYPEAHYNLGASLKKQGDLIGAIASYKAALNLKPDYPKAHYNLGNAYQEIGDLTSAISTFKTALKLNPDYTKASLNLAMAELMIGDYKSGLERYEFRFKNKENKSILASIPPCKIWDGNLNIKNNKLLLVSEQGLGDTLQFMRYATVLRDLEISVSLCAQTKLHTLIQASGIDQAPLTPEQADKFSDGRWIPLLSLPRHLNVSPDNPIITYPYIKAPEKKIEKWRHILAQEQKPIIGINWQGNPLHETTNSKGRSLPLESFAPITKIQTITLLSLQKGLGSEQLDSCSFKDRFVGSQDRINDTWDFLETAAIIANCELVITSDTSVAHLAGGMGKTTWLLLKKVPEWRWGLEGESTFWYPSMRLFRQSERCNWDEVLQRVAVALEEHVQSYINATHTMAEQKSETK